MSTRNLIPLLATLAILSMLHALMTETQDSALFLTRVVFGVAGFLFLEAQLAKPFFQPVRTWIGRGNQTR